MNVGLVHGWSATTPGVVYNVVEADSAIDPCGVEDMIELTGDAWIGWVVNTDRSFSPPLESTVPVEETYQKLWQAAHDYEYLQISGSAVGLLTLGVLQGKPKCTAVQNWIKDIWTLYYTRKATVTPTPPDATFFDFSSVGECPHSVPELMIELGM